MADLKSINPGGVLQKLSVSTSPNAVLEEDSKQKTQDSKSTKSNGEAEKEIVPKQFFWDQLITYMATTIALLTLLDVTLQFFRATSALVCYVPTEFMTDFETTRDQAAFVNAYCLNSLPQNEYYSVFILIQGILIVAPHYLWSSIFSGQFDFFFDLVRQIDRLRDSKTGEYRTRNFEILKKLENQFPENWKWYSIFAFYIGKLVLQWIIIALAIVLNPTVFPHENFDFIFECPRNFNESVSTNGWLLPGPVQCVYSSFRILSKVQYVDYMLLVLALGAVSYGLFWCFKRHTSSLGYGEIATFAFTSCLSPLSYVFNRLELLSPRIRNDLDFLLMRLFRADSGHGRVFKDLQVDKELKRLVSEDHEQLALTTSIIHDIDERFKRKPTIEDAKRRCTHYTQSDEERRLKELEQELKDLEKLELEGVKDLTEVYRKSKFGDNPINTVRARLGPLFLGNMERAQASAQEVQEVKSIRNQFFSFLESTSKKFELAYDISFGTIGFALILARAFKNVVSVNFHPFYQNEKEVCRKEAFHANYSRFTIQDDIFSLSSDNITKFDESLEAEFHLPGSSLSKRVIRQANLIVVGPFMEEAKKATVNLHIQRLYFGRLFAQDAFLLAIRPLKIGHKDVQKLFCRYEPPHEMFQKAEIKRIEKKQGSGFYVTCNKTICIFEFVLYEFIRKYPPRPTPPKPPLAPGQLPPGFTPPNNSTNRNVNATREQPPPHANIATSTDHESGANNTTQQSQSREHDLSSTASSRPPPSNDHDSFPIDNYNASPQFSPKPIVDTCSFTDV